MIMVLFGCDLIDIVSKSTCACVFLIL